jgi:hypothetical protein
MPRTKKMKTINRKRKRLTKKVLKKVYSRKLKKTKKARVESKHLFSNRSKTKQKKSKPQKLYNNLKMLLLMA